uniref:ATP synthase subunit delta, chloroplastic n=1 Tax=Rhodosorus marinus TaxID=101924 RepID=A0A7S2ZSB2_9RHOD|mmetsp:Transcript_30902/g.118434  ORF Transcript_30902/g.118434 Transcript_30902/m.118434 type:complete len:183 (+) Transcript_30902:2808-3356(+)
MSSRAIFAKIAQPYAEALLDTIGSGTDVTKEIKLIANTLSNSSELQALFSNPMVTSEAKKDLLEKAFGKEINPKLLIFLKVLADRKRLNMLDAVIEKYLEIAYENANITLAKVVASVPLSNEQQQALISKIKAMTQSSEVELLTQVDSDLIGGLTIQIGSQVIDTSLQGQIKQMASHLDINL